MPQSGKHDKTMRVTSTSVVNLLVFVGLLGLGLAAYRLYRSGLVTLPTGIWGTHATLGEDFRKRCLSFEPQIRGAKLERVEHLEVGSRATLEYRDSTCGGPGRSQAVAQDICRVALYVSTSERSGFHLEAWLPKTWNSRFLGTGNGGLGGCLDYASLVYTTSHGFAAVASNNGHNGTSGLSFYQNSDILHDFADRAIHTSALSGKSLAKQFYGTEHKKSYFLGCSQGGRQGVANSMKFPNDYDGIVAGAPALDFNSLVSWRASFYPITGSSASVNFIRPEVWLNLIHHEVLRQCDHLDGVVDGVIEYPDLCKFEPEVLLCEPGAAADDLCLSGAQIEQLRKIYAPYKSPDGSLIFPGMLLGSEQRAIHRLYAGRPFTDSEDWFKYVVHSDLTWEPAGYNFEDAEEARKLNPFDIRTFPSPKDLITFREKGGKLLVYHGMQDQQITGHNTGRWYDYLSSQSPSIDDLDEWIRYFRISGLLHCFGGSGAWMIGQAGGSVGFEAQKNILAAIVAWVEDGVAPDTLEGTRLAKRDPQSSIDVQVADYTRRHCRYPQVNRYIGQGTQGQAGDLDRANLPTWSSADEWICG